MRTNFYTKLITALALTAVASVASAKVVFSGVSPTSDDYALGVVWSGLARQAGIDMTVVENGTVAGLRKTAMNETDMVAIGAPHYRDAVNGSGAYARDPESLRSQYKNMKAILGLPSGMAQYLVNAQSDIHSFADFNGKKVGIGRPGGNAGQVSKELFKLQSIKVDGQHLEYGPALEQLATGSLDGTLVWGSIPNASIDNASRSTKLRFVSLDADTFAKLQSSISNGEFYILQEVPAKVVQKAYEGRVEVDGDTARFWTFPWQIMVRADMDEKTVYTLTKTLWEGINKVHDASPALSLININDTLKGISADLHPGAARYYREIGKIK
ncbi:TAXI family TRAP transporter solute-binding subunit [Allopusillimonas ginsengisoli]|nr:TAXI family TRAP transporter solute-binding subunit [Allopusillimonas ginsengisoli]